jgi:hypothetical protein
VLHEISRDPRRRSVLGRARTWFLLHCHSPVEYAP